MSATPAFAALRIRGYRAHFSTYLLAMMADNIEHVISYWICWQKFHSPALGGFAVVSHWLPFLLFAVPVGALADRFDPRRLIQCGMALFIAASLGWGMFFLTDTLQMWHAMLLLVLHGCAGVLWQTSSQMLLHDIAPKDTLQSAVRLNATARSLGVLVGPAVGGVLMLLLGPTRGILVNAAFSLPLVLWLVNAPYGPRFRAEPRPSPRAVRGFADITQTLRDIAPDRLLTGMLALAGTASFFIGNSYQAQMPAFAHDLGHGDPGVSYSALLAADAAGALLAGVVLESVGRLKPAARTAMTIAAGWALALAGFSQAHAYGLALALLFLAGFLELSFSSMVQTLVQLNAPTASRGRVLGLFNMASLGMRTFSGVTVGLVGSSIGVHGSLLVAGLLMCATALVLRVRTARPSVA